MLRKCLITAGLLSTFATSAMAQDRIDDALSNPQLDWLKTKTQHFEVHYLASTLTPAGVEEAGRRLEDSLSHNLVLLGESRELDQIRALLVGSREEMAEVVGTPYGGLALPDERAVVLVSTADGRAATQHELMHLAAYEVWGRPHEPRQWISEGLATFAPGRCAEFTLSSLGSLMAETGRLPTLRALVDDFYSVPDLYTYLAGASFVEFVYRSHGVGAVRVFWSEGLEAGVRTLGKGVAALEAEWRASLRLAEHAPPEAWDRIRSVGCEGP